MLRNQRQDTDTKQKKLSVISKSARISALNTER